MRKKEKIMTYLGLAVCLVNFSVIEKLLQWVGLSIDDPIVLINCLGIWFVASLWGVNYFSKVLDNYDTNNQEED